MFWEELAKGAAQGGTQGILTGVGSMIRDIGDTIRGKSTLTNEEVTQLELKVKDLELATQSAQVSMITAEASSSDKWTSRARPSFMYVFYIILLTCGVVAPFFGVFFPTQMVTFFGNMQKGFAAIPDGMWATFSVGYTGYVGARTYEKYSALKMK